MIIQSFNEKFFIKKLYYTAEVEEPMRGTLGLRDNTE